MDSRVVESQVHEHDEHHPHNVGLQGVALDAEEQHHDLEKKSVLNKVKAKAKKIKDTIKKHAHHDHDHGHEYRYEDQHIPDDHDLDVEDDEDEKMVEDPEVLEAPIYESAAVKGPIPGQVENLGKSGVDFEGTTVMAEEPYRDPQLAVVSPTTEINQSSATDPARTFVGEEKPGQHKVNLERPVDMEEDTHVPGSRHEAYTPPNYQTKVTDPTGAGTAEIDITPVEESFARINVQEEPKPNPEPIVLPKVAETPYPSEGSHDHFVSDLSTSTKTQYPSAESHDQYLPELSSATKTQYPSAGSHDHFVPDDSTATKTQYPSAESHDQFAPETISTSTDTETYPENPEATEQTFNSSTAVEEQPSYESMEKSSNQSSYTDKISLATSAIADKAVSAKDAVASKLGYGEKGDRDDKVTAREEEKSGDASNKSGSATESGNKIPFSLTEKLAPVYGKVAGVGSAVKSKVTGTGTGASTGNGSETESGVKEQDKGVSVKGYLAEKLRPGEEDRVLSEVISEAFRKRKEEPAKAYGDEERDVTKLVSDAIHKREEEPDKSEHGNLDKVTESEEVKRRLGTGDEKTDKVSEESHVNSPGKGVVDKLKDVVGSWFGKAGDSQYSQVAGGEDLSKNSGAEVEQFGQPAGERRLQEPTN